LLDDSNIIELFFGTSRTGNRGVVSEIRTDLQQDCKKILKNDLDAEECVNDT